RTHTARRSFGRATAPQSGHGTTRAMVSTSSSSSPPASAAASTRNPSNPNNAATTEPVTSASTWGSSTIRVILVVITDRASPRPTISSFQSPRRVARSPHSQVRGEEPHLEAAGDHDAAYGWHMRAAAWSTHRDIAAAVTGGESARQIADELPDEHPGRIAMRIAPRTMLCGAGWRVDAHIGGHFQELRELCALAGDK